MAEELKQLIDAEGVKKIWEKTKEYVANNTGIKKTYTLTSVTGSEWWRLCKITDISTPVNSFIKFIVDQDMGGHITNISNSIFSINVSLDSDDIFENLKVDITPITHTPDYLNLSDSTSGSAGSAGSGSSSVLGLASLTVEKYEGEMWLCGLINISNSGSVTININMELVNPFNIEPLETPEIVILTDVNEEEMQVLEGTTYKKNIPYEFRIGCNLQSFIDGLSNNTTIQLMLNTSTTLLCYNNTTLYILGTGGTNPSNFPYDLYNYSNLGTADSLLLVGDSSTDANGNSEIHILDAINNTLNINEENFSSKLKTFSGSISLKIFSNNSSAQGVVHTEALGTIGGFDLSEGNNVFTYSLSEITENNDKIYLTSSSTISFILYVAIEPSTSEIEINIPYKSETEMIIESYEISNNDVYNFSLTSVELIKHYTSDSYDLFSVYNQLDFLADLIENKTKNVEVEATGLVNELRREIIYVTDITRVDDESIKTLCTSIWNEYFNYDGIGTEKLVFNKIIFIRGSSPNLISLLGIASSAYNQRFIEFIDFKGKKIYRFRAEAQDVNELLDSMVVEELQRKLTAGNNITIEDNVISATGGVESEDVLNIIEENASQVDSMTVGTSDNYDTTSDTQVPTTKAVQTMIDVGSSSTQSLKKENYIDTILGRKIIVNTFNEIGIKMITDESIIKFTKEVDIVVEYPRYKKVNKRTIESKPSLYRAIGGRRLFKSVTGLSMNDIFSLFLSEKYMGYLTGGIDSVINPSQNYELGGYRYLEFYSNEFAYGYPISSTELNTLTGLNGRTIQEFVEQKRHTSRKMKFVLKPVTNFETIIHLEGEHHTYLTGTHALEVTVVLSYNNDEKSYLKYLFGFKIVKLD